MWSCSPKNHCIANNNESNINFYISYRNNLYVCYVLPLRNNTFNIFMHPNKSYLWKSATNLTSAMTILCSMIMCLRSLSCSDRGKCSSQKIQGTDGKPFKVVVPPGLSGRESGSRIQSLLSAREKKRKKRTETNSL